MSYSSEQTSTISYAMAIALAVHGVLILGITFRNIQKTAPDIQMEVTFSHSKSNEQPLEADYIAQSNQMGSGTQEEDRILTNTAMALMEDTQVNRIDPFLLPETREYAETTEPRIITTTGESPFHVVVKDIIDEDPGDDTTDFIGKNLEQLSREIASLEAKLAEREQRYTKEPRVLRVTSSSTIAAKNAEYIHRWRDRIETVGNLHYPDKAREEKLYGDVRLLVGINANGTVEEIRILESSGIEILDRAALESIRLASPFEPFSSELAAEYDRIEVIRTWQFRKNRLQSRR